jgi:hypothetical protein
MQDLDFSTLTLGAPAAERDITQGLADYFVESEAFRRVAEGPKRIVLGNRGTGKSAIFKVLAERRRKAKLAVIELAPEDYSYEMLTSRWRRSVSRCRLVICQPTISRPDG